MPVVCMLDPDGDVVSRLQAEGRAYRHHGWACYHAVLYVFEENGLTLGVVACVVGAPFAVLVAEQSFASGCQHLISVTSAGQLVALREPPYFVLIERALRDEGASYHYLPASQYSAADPEMIAGLDAAFSDSDVEVVRGSSWATDAPFRETDEAIDARCARGLVAVEMEVAALYAFAQARKRSVVCLHTGPIRWARSRVISKRGSRTACWPHCGSSRMPPRSCAQETVPPEAGRRASGVWLLFDQQGPPIDIDQPHEGVLER